MNEYERARAERIAENAKRLAELVPANMVAALVASPPPSKKRSHKAKAAAPRLTQSNSPKRRSSRQRGEPLFVVEDGDADEGEERRGAWRRGSRAAGAKGEYGTADGTTCHFCRQKTSCAKASCAKCPLKFCGPCLWNRHGETIHTEGEWQCPKCRKCCTCSACMRRLGLKPTGIMAPRAADEGFASVEDMLRAQGVFDP